MDARANDRRPVPRAPRLLARTLSITLSIALSSCGDDRGGPASEGGGSESDASSTVSGDMSTSSAETTAATASATGSSTDVETSVESDASSTTTDSAGATTGAPEDARCLLDPGPFPVPDWPVGAPEDHGLDPDKLQAAADYAATQASNCLVVIRHGTIVGEWYWQGTDAQTKVKSWSVGKSYAATAVGLALDRGAIASLDDPAADYIPEWQGTDHEVVSIRNLLQMASGLEFGLFADNISMFLAMDMTQRALDNPLAKPPLTDWEYNNHGVQVLEPVLRGATGLTAEEYSQLHLWQPMGMDAEWLKDDVGHPAMYMNVLASCRDHARFGYLYLHDGCWDGEELVSEGFIDDARSPSQQLNRGYGYLWWLSGQEPTLDSVDFKPKPGGLHPFGPDDSYCAVGLGNQVIEVIPSHDMVMVRMGTAPMDDPEKWLTPLQLLDEVLEDGKQLIHNQVLELVLDAVVE
ncbi:MAG: serine hydrolase [Myxococcales bacterium]|nr:serine hydrolase [Myxococcales bacterium]